MLISYKDNKLEKEFCHLKLLRRRWGDKQGHLIAQRLTEIKAAENLSDLARLPQLRVHELKGNRKWQISLDVKHPYRLLIVPDHEEMPLKKDAGLDWTKITSVKVLGVEDTHD